MSGVIEKGAAAPEHKDGTGAGAGAGADAGAGAGAGADADAGAGGGEGGAHEREEGAPPLPPALPPPPSSSSSSIAHLLSRPPATLLDVLDVTAAMGYLPELQSCVGLCRESACLEGSTYQPMLLTLLALQKGSEEGYSPKMPDGDSRKKGPRKRLHHAAMVDDASRVRMLVKAGTKVDARTCQWWTPLIFACSQGMERSARTLLELGARISAIEVSGSNALSFAAAMGHVHIITLLAGWGANVDETAGYRDTPLMAACRRGEEEAARALLDLGASHRSKDLSGCDAFWYAACGCMEPIVRLLAARGADLHTANNEGNTPLMIALRDGNEDTAILLLELGAADGVEAGGEKEARVRQAAEIARSDRRSELADAILARLPAPAL